MPKHNPVGMSMSVTLEGFEYQKDLYCKFCLSPQTDFGSEPNPLNLGLKLCLIYLRILWKPVCGKNSNLLIFIVFLKQFNCMKNEFFVWTSQWVRWVQKRNFESWISLDFVVLVNSLGFK
jgi:hypothetical protein